MKDIISSNNEKTWDIVANQFTQGTSLPVWGPFGVGDNLNLIPKIKGKVFLEIACGSGRSIKYLSSHGAKKVYGIDFSQTQIDEAKSYNKNSLKKGKVVLIKSTMEKKIKIEPVDIVFSVYGIGWTLKPEKTFKNIFSYLKPGGLFIWSWDHTIFSDIAYKNGEFFVKYSYHKENIMTIKNWRNNQNSNAYLKYRKTSTWFNLLLDAGFEIKRYYEPKPKNIRWGSKNREQYYSIEKANKVPATCIFVCKKPK